MSHTADPALAQLGPLAHSAAFGATPEAEVLRQAGYRLQPLRRPGELPGDCLALLLDTDLCDEHAPEVWRGQALELFILSSGCGEAIADLVLPTPPGLSALRAALKLAQDRRRLNLLNDALSRNLAQSHLRLNQLTEVGTALSAETDIHRLLDRILTDGRRIACCDAVSLFLIDQREDGSRELVFKLTQNASIDFPFSEHRFPLDDTSLVGHVAQQGEELNISDVYRLSPDLPYRFHRGIDEAMGYRSVSMLLLPLSTPQGQIIGVLEFINRKDRPDRLLRGREAAELHTLPFEDSEISALRALCGQAATAIANNLLMSSMGALFDGFVAAAVTALEEPSHAVGEHGYRVGELAVSTAEAYGRQRGQTFDDRALRELRYACLLHDFGHAGLRRPGQNQRIAAFRKRLAQERERLKQRQFQALMAGQRALLLPDVLARIDSFLHAVEKADVPALRPEALFPRGKDGAGLFSTAVARGELNETQQTTLDGHLRHTLAFLARLDWHPELAPRHDEATEAARLALGSRLLLIAELYELLTEEGIGAQKPEQALALLREACGEAGPWRAVLEALAKARDAG
ncbi:MAG: GAF domain-containing protein [Gammaproteobacteria bacterium]|nr:GAF domain-containing protein [Gammaproteobacteria bacterium]